MTKSHAILTLISSICLSACLSTVSPATSDTLTRAEAKTAACPISVLEAGASPADCDCVENHLYEIGQKPGAIQYDETAPKSEIGTSSGRRDIAIGLLRLDAFEHCGLFEPDHAVSKNL